MEKTDEKEREAKRPLFYRDFMTALPSFLLSQLVTSSPGGGTAVVAIAIRWQAFNCESGPRR